MKSPEISAAVVGRVLGDAPTRTPTIRTLAAAAGHGDCNTAMVALAVGADLDQLCEGTGFAVDFGQDPQAFKRGVTFEERLKANSYARLVDLLRQNAGFPIKDVRIEDLRHRYPPNQAGLRLRAVETRRVLRQIADADPKAPNLIDGAVLTCAFAGKTAYFEADSLAAVAGGRLHVGEVKSFAYTDGRCDPEKFGSACDQAAWYILLCRKLIAEMGRDPNVVSSEAFIILPIGVGLTPGLVRQEIGDKIRRAEAMLDSPPNPGDLLRSLDGKAKFPGLKVPAHDRIEDIEALMDQAGTRYKPACLSDCGLSRLCRVRAHDAGNPQLCGGDISRALPGVASLERAAELTAGAKPGVGETAAARVLARAGAIYDRVLKWGEL